MKNCLDYPQDLFTASSDISLHSAGGQSTGQPPVQQGKMSWEDIAKDRYVEVLKCYSKKNVLPVQKIRRLLRSHRPSSFVGGKNLVFSIFNLVHMQTI